VYKEVSMIDKTEEMSQSNLIMEYFKKNPKRDIKHPEIVDWVVDEYKKRTSEKLKQKSKLLQEYILIKISKPFYYEKIFYVYNLLQVL